ncbi:hypothetical protein KIN20_026542 [Parelaphostrongylus tenuis]|uniref:Uncharacterized protein n=1 Tax=Parelaphostrongylus tenuis TaxID=148309 RepID=A0AAD5QY52_PARTN|nr:hypothetical protein KIN20_026542 [Parelaphostrongylus tenuis]
MEDGRLTMGCLDAVKQWDYIAVCFSTPGNETGCSYNPRTKAAFDQWGAGMCCCRTEKCNQLPPHWLALSKWHFRWRIFASFIIVFTFLSVIFFVVGFIEGTRTSIQEKKRIESISIDTVSGGKHSDDFLHPVQLQPLQETNVTKQANEAATPFTRKIRPPGPPTLRSMRE